MWTVSSSMNECMEVLLKKMSLPTHILDQGIWKLFGGGGGETIGKKKKKKKTYKGMSSVSRAGYSRNQ